MHIASSRELPPTSAPPRAGAVIRARDFVIAPTLYEEVSDDELEAHPPATNIRLATDITLGRLTDAETEIALAACTPRGHYWIAVRQFGQRYSFIREVPSEEFEPRLYAWDEGSRLAAAVALSRLVRDNAHCPEFAGRLVDYASGDQQVIPLLGHEFRLAYRLRFDRGWLDDNEALDLATLLAAYFDVEPDWPQRVRRAINAADRAAQLPYLHEAQPRVVTGLESLLATSREGVSKQFRERVFRVATEVGISGISKRMLDRMYNTRSEAYHGAEVRLFSGHPGVEPGLHLSPQQRQTLDDAIALQDTLRRLVRLCIEDPAFRAVFADDARIRSTWPVMTRRRFRWRQL